ncbi:MTH1187 family thiamine-binding protein [Pseudodesulfovibrio cashew]|uniref:MTH1187 family thiamine-binding protein n=1 Tax=Pseudodesulfovibrio cashew TaxID=2678688 RepID=A0A6I6JDQ4_9BACT|nr:MTH1187 family thiamine-binding protein [Pseudodesulfovibrio cashew]QGY38763.1 MTH1187 family thiamine-binding protein [Pseudodesulfovibrio cashew]
MSVIVDLTIFPMDKGGSGLSTYVSRVLNLIRESGLKHQLGPMGTAIEGEWDEVMAVVTRCYKALEPDCDRLYVNIKADVRKGRTDGLKTKVGAVMAKAGS